MIFASNALLEEKIIEAEFITWRNVLMKQVDGLEPLNRFSKISSEIRKGGVSGCRKERSNNGTFI